jgi:uncharacterized protein YjeT (DUF2065 family)
MSLAALALGLVLCLEGLVFALMPSRMDDLAALVASLTVQQRRGLGLAALAIGVILIWIAGPYEP